MTMSTDVESHPQLQPFQVIIEPRIAGQVRSLKLNIKRNRKLILWVTGLILINSGCAAYQLVESYRVIYLGSKIAATLLRTPSIERTWGAFYWIYAILTFYYNITFLTHFGDALRNWMPWYRLLDSPNCGVAAIAISLHILAYTALLNLCCGPFWLAFPIRRVWQAIAWSRACNNWDIDAVISGVRWDTMNQTLPLVGIAIVKVLGKGNYTMRLDRSQLNSTVYNWYLKNSVSVTPPLNFISYDISHQTYTVNNITNIYHSGPVSFPMLGLRVQDPSIPFVNPNDDCYPPSLDLVQSNGSAVSNVLRTVMLNVQDCTTLKVCGMNDVTGSFQIGLGVVMMEQFRSSVYCTTPYDSPHSLG
jgi:hypothetical protein